MSDSIEKETLITLTADIVSAHVSNNSGSGHRTGTDIR
jgi:predicted transcriptional regulator